jgi:hypothetical protein
MRCFEVKQDESGIWTVLREGKPLGHIVKGKDAVYRAVRHWDGELTRHSDWPAALMELVQ